MHTGACSDGFPGFNGFNGRWVPAPPAQEKLTQSTLQCPYVCEYVPKIMCQLRPKDSSFCIFS